MKILELRFKNLNSLVGEWCIDFTDPEFAADGLFAITGPTGSGKTTILDALCLALYGQTPRLPKVNQSTNEAMSRQTGECFAEVRFETAQGTYRAYWHQQRARKKTDGALQAPKREMADQQGTVLATKLRDVQEKIDAVVGMGFDRFTRSILLAQGSFDSFLKADADDRSPILEQITGTEIYTEISKLVHQRNSAENQKLNELKAGLGGIALLSPEELEQLAFDLRQVQETYQAEAVRRDAAKAAMEGLKRIETLTNELAANRAEQAAWAEENEAFRPDAERLAAAKRAQPLAVEYARLASLRNERDKTGSALKAAAAALPGLEEQQTQAALQLEADGKALKEKEAALQELAPILKQTRALDTQLAGRLASQQSDEAELEQLLDEEKALRAKVAAHTAELEKLQTQEAEAQTYQVTHALDAGLVGQLSAMLQSLEQLAKLSAEKDNAQATAELSETAAQQAAETAAEEQQTLAAVQTEFSAATTALEKIQRELAPLRDGTDWRTRIEALRQRVKIEQRMLETRKTLSGKTAEAAEAEKELIQQKNEQEGLRREQVLVSENLLLQQKIESLEAERAALADGQPCPLCGALEHPYAAGLPDRETSSLEKINAALSALGQRINALSENVAAATADNKTLSAALRNDEAELETLPPGDAQAIEKIAARIAQIETLERDEIAAKTALDGAREAVARQTLTEQGARQHAHSATEKAATAKTQERTAEAALTEAQAQLRQKIEP
uniref:AAA family ATPase n=1 Tax=Pontiella sp. TaxID=2837462 RepID=UPI0035666754